jgi:hypothetical protein
MDQLIYIVSTQRIVGHSMSSLSYVYLMRIPMYGYDHLSHNWRKNSHLQGPVIDVTDVMQASIRVI